MSTTTAPVDSAATTTDLADGVLPRAAAAVLALAVSALHVVDQGGLTVLKDPAYVGQGYRLLELGGLLAAVLLLVAPARRRVSGWLLALGVAVGPLVGFVLSRGPGLPGYTDDKGNWTETLALQAMTVEVLLLGLAVAALAALGRRGRA